MDGVYQFLDENGHIVEKIVEFKCPWTFREETKRSLINEGNKLPYIENGKLKKNHTYYAQIQFYLWVYKLQECSMFIWCPKDFIELNILFDVEYCNKMMRNLVCLYEDWYARVLFM